MSAPSTNDDLAGEGLTPPPVELRQFNPSARQSDEDTNCLLNLWHALQRSAADAALATEPDRNVFVFQSGCLYFATIHDPLFRQKLENERLAREAAAQNDESARRASLLSQAKRDLRQLQRQAPPSAPASDRTDRLSLVSSQWNANSIEQATTLDYDSGASDESTDMRATQTNSWPDPYTNTASVKKENDGWSTAVITSPLGASPYATPKSDAPLESDFIGIVYLLAPAPGSAPASCEASLGIAIVPQMRRQGFGSEAVRRVLTIAFDDFLFHRVSVGVLGPSTKPRASSKPQFDSTGKGKLGTTLADKSNILGMEVETEAAMSMFVGAGFIVEGMRRRAVPDFENNGEWRDAHYLTMLDTDWLAIKRAELADLMRKNASTKGKGRAQDNVDTVRDGFIKKRTRWDEMLARHQREQETLAGAESRLKRSASTETLRPGGGIIPEMLPDNLTVTSASANASEAGADLHSERASVRSYISDPFSDSARPVSYGSTEHLIARGASGILDADIDMDSEYGEETAKSKVARYLHALSEYEPPQSSAGSVSDFESSTELKWHFESGENYRPFTAPERIEKNDAKKAFAGDSRACVKGVPDAFLGVMTDSDVPSSKNENESTQTPIKEASKTFNDVHTPSTVHKIEDTSKPYVSYTCADEVDLLGRVTLNEAEEQRRPSDDESPSRKKRRLSGEENHIASDAGISIGGATTPLEERLHTTDDQSDSDLGSDSDVETASISTWDVLSGGVRSPSPSPSLSSGTGSLSLQSVSESDAE